MSTRDSADAYHRFLSAVHETVVRLGVREYLTAEKILQAAREQSWSQQELGDALTSALAHSEKEWDAVRSLFTRYLQPAEAAADPRAAGRRPRVEPPRTLLALTRKERLRLQYLRARTASALALAWLRRRWLPALMALILIGAAGVGVRLLIPPPQIVVRPPPPPPPPPQSPASCERREIQDSGFPSGPSEKWERPELVHLPPWTLAATWVGTFGISALGMSLLWLLPLVRRRRAEKEAQATAQRAQAMVARESMSRALLRTRDGLRPHYWVDLKLPIPSEAVEDSATQLGRVYQAVRGVELDVPRTLAQTLDAGGELRPVFAAAKQRRELLVLYDEAETKPYLPVFHLLLQRWARLGVGCTQFGFRSSPEKLWTPKGGRGPLFKELARRHEGAALILYASRLEVRARTDYHQWPQQLQDFALHVWLDPDPRPAAQRSLDEQQELELLTQYKLPRFPLTPKGLVALARYLVAEGVGVVLPEWETLPLLTEEDRHKAVELWLSLGAVVPDAGYDQLEGFRQQVPRLRELLPDWRCMQLLLARTAELVGPGFRPGASTLTLKEDQQLERLHSLHKKDRSSYLQGHRLVKEQLPPPPTTPREEWTRPQWEVELKRTYHEAADAEPARQEELLDPYRTSPVAPEAEAMVARLEAVQGGPAAVVQGPRRLRGGRASGAAKLTVREALASTAAALLRGAAWGALLTLLAVGTWELAVRWPKLGQALRPGKQRIAVRLQRAPMYQADCPQPKAPPVSVVAEAPKPAPAIASAPTPKKLPRVPKTTDTDASAVPVAAPGPVRTVVPQIADAGASPADLGPPPKGGVAYPLVIDASPSASVSYRPKLLRIKARTFQMGSADNDRDGYPNERPQHEVKLSRDYLMMETEVTQGQYRQAMETPPLEGVCASAGVGDDLPMVCVSWVDAARYANRLSELEEQAPCYQIAGETVRWPAAGCAGYRLPTEAEWEYAARGGQSYPYAGSSNVDEVAWYQANSGGKLNTVKTKRANGYKLYDLSGSVWEWVWDQYGPYVDGSQIDPKGPSIGVDRVLRGGSWVYSGFARVAYRAGVNPGSRNRSQGFRLVRSYP